MLPEKIEGPIVKPLLIPGSWNNTSPWLFLFNITSTALKQMGSRHIAIHP